MSWNHRVLVIENGDDYWYGIHEVYYDENGKPESHTIKPADVTGEGREDILWVLEKMKECLNKPFLWGDHRFPEEFKPDNK